MAAGRFTADMASPATSEDYDMCSSSSLSAAAAAEERHAAAAAAAAIFTAAHQPCPAVTPQSTLATSDINGVLEQGFHAGDAAALRHFDDQAAAGNIIIPIKPLDTHLNLLVCGETGLGKTTLIKSLIGTWPIQDEGDALKSPDRRPSLEQFRLSPGSMRVVLQPITGDGQFNMRLHITFQDTPGWGGDATNLAANLSCLLDFLLQQRRLDYVSNKAGQTESHVAPGSCMPRGITACLYLLPPHRAKAADWTMMAALSQLVAVIPVIAKADCMTAQELQAYRDEINQVLSQQQSSSPTDGAAGLSATNTFSFSAEDLAAVGATKLPFAVVCGSQSEPGRSYQWGTVLAFNRQHSDLIILKQLLCSHRNQGLFSLLDDSWQRARSFARSFVGLLREQLQAAGSDAGRREQLFVALAGLTADGNDDLMAQLSLEPVLEAVLRNSQLEVDSTAPAAALAAGQAEVQRLSRLLHEAREQTQEAAAAGAAEAGRLRQQVERLLAEKESQPTATDAAATAAAVSHLTKQLELLQLQHGFVQESYDASAREAEALAKKVEGSRQALHVQSERIAKLKASWDAEKAQRLTVEQQLVAARQKSRTVAKENEQLQRECKGLEKKLKKALNDQAWP